MVIVVEDDTGVERWSVRFIDEEGRLVEGWSGRGQSNKTISWNGYSTVRGGRVAGGQYECILSAVDRAGNTGVAREKVRIVASEVTAATSARQSASTGTPAAVDREFIPSSVARAESEQEARETQDLEKGSGPLWLEKQVSCRSDRQNGT